MECAEKIAKAMLMMEPEEAIDYAGVCDALGEVTNLLIGGVKSRLGKFVSDVEISIPSITKGQQVRPVLGKGAINVELTTSIDGEIMKLSMMYKKVS